MATKVGVFLFNGFQELEFWYPVLRLREVGADVTVIGIEGAEAASSLLGYPVVPNLALTDTAPGEYAALVIPGGQVSGIAENDAFRKFLREAAEKGVRIAAASQAASLLPHKNSPVARTTDDVPQWTRNLLKELNV